MTPYRHFRILSKIIDKNKIANEDLTAHGDEMISNHQFHESLRFEVISFNLLELNNNEVLFTLMVVGNDLEKDLV